MKNSMNAKKSFLDRALTFEGAVQLDTGALVVSTGKYTGRCPTAKFFVCDPLDEKSNLIDWENNQRVTEKYFLETKERILHIT